MHGENARKRKAECVPDIAMAFMVMNCLFPEGDQMMEKKDAHGQQERPGEE